MMTLRQGIRLAKGKSYLEAVMTKHMYSLEEQFQQPIMTLLLSHKSVTVTAQHLGVSKSCVSKWRHRFGVDEVMYANWSN